MKKTKTAHDEMVEILDYVLERGPRAATPERMERFHLLYEQSLVMDEAERILREALK